jgi:predicted nucleotidyltransferase
MASLERILSDFKQAMFHIYGDQLASVILYGSYARGDQQAESDIDLAVVLRTDHVERWREVERIAPITVELSDKYNCLIAPIVVEAKRLASSGNLFLRAIQQEGRTL